jgi:tetratricopeptide (TPR) repeat protein
LERARQLRSEAIFLCVGVCLITVVVYARSLTNAAVWDDKPLVVDNPYLGSWSGLAKLFSSDLWTASAQGEPSSFYRPMTMATYWLNSIVGGRSAASFRLGNILLHAGNAVMLTVLVRAMRAAGWRLAAVVALAWSLAPICSEPVVWISGRFDPLLVSFALVALLGARWKSRWALPLTMLAIGCGIFSKETFIGWLPLVFLDDGLFRGFRASDAAEARQRWIKYAGIVTFAAAYFVARGALGLPSTAVAIQTGLLSVFQSYFFLLATFVRELVLPTTLDPYRPYAPLATTWLVVTVLLLVPTCAAVIRIYWTHRENTRAKTALFGTVWFFLTAAPSALVGPNLDMIGDRYAYLPLVGLAFTVAAAIGWAIARLDAPVRRAARARIPVAVVVGGVLATEALLTWRRSRDWRDDIALARSSLASSPGNPYALSTLGTMAAQRGDLDEADQLLTEALANNPRAYRTWNAVCYLRLHQNRLDEAEHACIESLNRNPDDPRGWVNLASVYVQRGRWREASMAAERAIALKERYGEARYLAAAAAANLGNFERAHLHLARGIQVDPQNPRLLDLQRQFDGRGR